MTALVSQFLKWVFFGLIPPEPPDDWGDNGQVHDYRKQKVRWRHAVAISVWVLAASTIVLTVFVFDWVPDAWNQVAWASDVREEVEDVRKEVTDLQEQVAEIKSTADDTRLSQLRVELRDMRRLQCRAIEARDAERKLMYGQALEKLKRQYRRLSPTDPWEQPGCDEV